MTYHVTHANSVHDTAAVVANIVQDGALARVKGDAEAPLLPLDQIGIRNGKAGPLGLQDGEGLEVLADAAGEQLGHVLGRAAVVQDADLVGDADEGVVVAPRGGLVDAQQRHGAGVDNGDKGQRVGVKVGVGVAAARVAAEAEGLEEARLAVGVVGPAVRPGLDDELEAVGEGDGLELLLELGGLLDALDDLVKLEAGLHVRNAQVRRGRGPR